MIIFCWLALKTRVRLRADFWGSLITYFILYGARFYFFDAFLQHQVNIGGYDENHVIALLILSVMIDLIISTFYPSIRRFFYYAYSGQMEPFLTKPTPVIVMIMLRSMNPLRMLIFMIIFVGLFVYIPISVMMGIAVLFMLFCSAGLNLAVLTLAESLVFVSKRNLPVDFIYSELDKLSQVPPTLFSGGIVWLLLFCPIVFSSTVIVEMVFNGFTTFVLCFISISYILLKTPHFLPPIITHHIMYRM